MKFIFRFLITGPMKLNGCPMRRINQNYLLATKTQVDITSVKLPETINDDYFKRAKAPKVSLVIFSFTKKKFWKYVALLNGFNAG